jgi:hypothetical protein
LAAATQLGVTEEALQAALGGPNQGPPDFAAAAAELGVTEEALIEALGLTAGTMPMASSPVFCRNQWLSPVKSVLLT